MNFPFHWQAAIPQPAELARWQPLFTRTIQKLIACSDVRLLPPEPELSSPATNGLAARLGVLAEQRLGISAAAPGVLVLPLHHQETVWGIAVLEGCSSSIADSRPGVIELGGQLAGELLQARQRNIDPVTGLPNAGHFREELGCLLTAMSSEPVTAMPTGAETPAVLSVALLEVYPWARNAEQGLLYIARAASYLDSLIGQAFPVHHFGSGVFGLLWRDVEGEQALKMGNGVLRCLKRENFVRAHLGLTSCQAAGPVSDRAPDLSSELLDQAWQGLQAARQRGPFALCTHAALAQHEDHPLAPPPPEVQQLLRKSWRGRDRFCLLLLHPDQPSLAGEVAEAVRTVLGPGEIMASLPDGEAYVLLPRAKAQQVREWVRLLKRRVDRFSGTVSVGAALYPCPGFTKSDLMLSARKALLHTAFYGPNTLTFFDSVSLNISGDVYYGEGDVARAVKEYRRGLQLDPANVNLLNSLGAAYGQANRYSLARPLFEQALRIDPENFMALFNLGFACLAKADRRAAIGYFEQALVQEPHHFDLLLQLGKLYCEAGRYEEAVVLLARAESQKPDGRSEVGYGTVHQYLGQAYKGLGRHPEAMASLQRAVRYNPRDARALSLLGELYALENQGDDIALSLCRQAVELDDTRWEYWYRLGWVQQRLEDFAAARSALRQSMRLQRRNAAAAYLLGRVYQEEGQVRQARRMFEQVQRWLPGHAGAAVALSGLTREA